MDVTILNTNLDAVSIVDTYESFIWTDRYYAYGDFELYEAMREGLLDYIKQDYYLQSKESEHVMIVEKIQITSDTEDGNHVTVTGRSLESILDRRIVWGQKLLSGNLQNGIKTLLNENVISPSDSNRKIPNFIFKESTDPAITKLKLEAQYTGDNLYDVIQKICEEQGIGFKITLNDHLVIMPDEALYNAQMNTTNVTTGGYVGSAMYKSNLANAKTIVNAAFQGSVLTHREYLCNAVANGRPSGGAWFDSSIELPNEPMMYGHPHFSPTSDGSTVPSIYTISKTQLALFMVCPRFIVNRSYNQWLRDVVSSANFAYVGNNGVTNYAYASYSFGVRPVFPVG